MRRRDREVTDPIQMEEIVKRCTCCRIGFEDRGEIYIVPLNFGYEIRDNTYTFYFHGAKEGRKFDLIQKEPAVGFEMDTNYMLQEAESACGYSARFQSIVGNGTIHTVTEAEEKKRGLSLIMEHSTGRKNWEFDEKMVQATAVFRLRVTKMSGKEHQ